MSDITGIGTGIEAITKAMSPLFRPLETVLQAHADNYAEKVRIEGRHSNTILDAELTERVKRRIAARELHREQNIEEIEKRTAQLLEYRNIDPDAVHEIEPDWMLAYLGKAQEVTDSDLQDLWAALLASKIQDGTRWSKRTLSTLADLSTDEAKLFEKTRPWVVLESGKPLGVIASSVVKEKGTFGDKALSGSVYRAAMILSQAGLVQMPESAWKWTAEARLSIGEEEMHFKALRARNTAVLEMYPLTAVGRELFRLSATTELQMDWDLVFRVVDRLRSQSFMLSNEQNRKIRQLSPTMRARDAAREKTRADRKGDDSDERGSNNG